MIVPFQKIVITLIIVAHLSFFCSYYFHTSKLVSRFKFDEAIFIYFYQNRLSGITVYFTYNSNNLDRMMHQEKILENISIYSVIHPIFTSDTNYAPKSTPNIQISKEDFSFFYDKFKNTKTKKESLERETGIISGLYKSMIYFLNETQDSWYLRLDDDEIYPPNLIKTLNRLENQYSMERPLLFGQFVRVWHWFFLGGGSGYLFNRNGVKYLVEHFDNFIDEKGYHFDIKFHLTLDHFGEKYETALLSGMTAELSPRSYYHFKLHYLKDENKFDTEKWEIPDCPPFNFSKEMTPFPIRDIFIYHHYWEMYKYNLSFKMMLDANPPPQVNYYKCNPECKLCWKHI